MEWRDSKRHVRIAGRRIAYVERGEGPPLVFLHGNPTSSYIWRSVIPRLEAIGRCIAPDLVGMSDSEKLPAADENRYTFACHRGFVDALLEELGVVSDVALVVHDWGSALGFDWARRHPDRVRAIAYMEAFVAPLTWEDYDPQRRDAFARLRSPAGEEMVLQHNCFVETILPRGILRTLADGEMDAYRRPFRHAGEDRLPTLVWPRQIPIDGSPVDVDEVIRRYSSWLARSDVPKLFINADPGALLTGRARELCRTWRHQTEVTVPGRHFVQEDSGYRIGEAIRTFLDHNPPGGER